MTDRHNRESLKRLTQPTILSFVASMNIHLCLILRPRVFLDT